MRFLRFLVVGGSAAIVQFSTLWLLKRWLSPDIAFSGAFVCSTLTHYCLNRFWALPSMREDVIRQFWEYLFSVIVSYAINLSAFKLCHDRLGLGVMWSACLAIPPSTIVVFILLNYRVFRSSENVSG